MRNQADLGEARRSLASAMVPTAPANPIQIRPGEAGRLIVLLPYTPQRVEKIKAVAGRRWHRAGRYWTVPHTEQALAHLLALLAGEPVDVDASLRPAAVPDDRPKVSRGAAPACGLLDELRRAIAARHYSRSTEQAYVAWVRRFVSFHGGRHPAQMGEGEVNRFLTHLATGERVAASTQNQALAALLFCYDKVLHRPLGQIEGVVRARRPRRLPVVLTREEDRAVLNELDGTPHLVCSLLYGSGLRLLECLRLRVKDIDLHRGEITVRDGKGGKDRVTVLPAAVRAPLHAHLERVRLKHANDLASGLGRVPLPDALARKYPEADRRCAWQWVFPASSHYVDRDTGFGTGITCTRRSSRGP